MIELKSLNLRVASRTLLFASILCRLQSNVLAGLSLEDFQDEEQDNTIYDDDGFIVEYPEDQEFIPTSNVVSLMKHCKEEQVSDLTVIVLLH